MHEILKCFHSNEATEQYLPVVLFILLYKVILTFKSVDEILKCCLSSESYRAVQGDLTFKSLDEIVKCDHPNEATEQYFPLVLFILLYKVILSVTI